MKQMTKKAYFNIGFIQTFILSVKFLLKLAMNSTNDVCNQKAFKLCLLIDNNERITLHNDDLKYG